jgi:hypothetical protein
MGLGSAYATPHPGQSVNVAIIGSAGSLNGGTLPTSGPAGELGDFTFTNLAPAAVSTASLTAFDTAVLNVASSQMACSTGTLSASAKSALVSFVNGGSKLIVYDSECAATDYTWLPFPFTTNNPGARGAFGTLTDLEENLLSSLVSSDPHYIDTGALSTQTDAVGDSNVFVTNNANWCADMSARNVNGVTGAVHVYAKTGVDQGLLIYNGLDIDTIGSGGGGTWLRKLWVQELQQPSNPSNLPCGITVVGITLGPATATNVIGTNHTVTSNLRDLNGNPKTGIAVTFTVLTGPNAGATGVAVTDVNGNASFTYTGTGGVGTDEIQACFDNQGTTVCSQKVTKTWTPPPTKVSINDATVTEGNTQLSPATPAKFTVSLDQASTLPVAVNFQTVDGTASSAASLDYVAKSGTVNFAPGETSKNVTIDVRGDLIDEPNETYTVVLSSSTNATIDDGSGLGTIIDDDRSGGFSCRGAGLRAPLLNEVGVSNAPNVPCKDGAGSLLNIPLRPGTIGVGATVVSSQTNQTPDDMNTAPALNDRSEADASATGVVLVLGTSVVRASVLKSHAEARCTSPLGGVPTLSSSATIASLTINGKNVATGNGYTRINLLLGVLHINHTTTTATSVTKRALWFENKVLPSSFDVVVAESKADFSVNPCK